ncbi:hypothetical protein DLD77_05480 [Chitinophaga alhagiae]|uniref:Glycosyltransferase family 4 protein n=1 Tax=Chitinophaga alhagiae TaxID=2203219 RepID=A0ABM6WAZ4_9BACT|nr:glycosyltransferase [Chitinophaga alhagiae]AWO01180.1 hypothetical protein DLD77_05480 [Chitinophaga alhagiae]
MTILHICSDYAKQSIYNNLVTSLGRQGHYQIVYVPVRTAYEVGLYQNSTLENTVYHYAHILKKYHRLLFHLKIRTVLKDLASRTDPSAVDIVHAHFLFSDGAVALRLKQQYGKPYIVAVRNTDINIFFRYMKHLKGLAYKILREAKQIIFLSPSYQEKLLNDILPSSVARAIKNKCIVVPNGADEFWFDHMHERRELTTDTLRLLYVGDFSVNKNIPSIISAAKRLATVRPVQLIILGGGGNGDKTVKTAAIAEKALVTLLPRTSDKNELLEQYRKADIFVMPSLFETFGIVYIEAMSQGLPVIYTESQGIDGYFPEGQIGYHVNPHNVQDIADKINAIAGNYAQMAAGATQAAEKFRWCKIADTYTRIYKS